MYSTNEDTISYVKFFNAVKDRVGIIRAKCFMSDMAHAMFVAWNQVMPSVTYRLYCSWHVGRAIRVKLSS